ncbi:MAG: hypothetical protein EI684_03325 [Candidatus Viridilinea halotolerans]|uniref:Co-chaperone DjlA N-terminal domain-containing protein n=1 Tax=Candidatus Viridilinea halotolerans TaxID=2491704 RepID=A0A426U7Z5_9CHLR|nr:MAG: hypothetical protein EI684_03325 [Candidatus Viridilinea halotolerans]
MALAKVVIAAAWADGHLAHEEVNSLKNLLAELGQTGGHGTMALTMQDWAELDIYLYSAVEVEERRRLVAELAALMHSDEERSLALLALDRIMAADRVHTDEERKVAEEVRNALVHPDEGLLASLGALLRRTIGLPPREVPGPNREEHLDEFLHNRVYYAVRVRLGKAPEEGLGIPASEARKLALAGGIMATVARLNDRVDTAEREKIIGALAQGWNLDRVRAEVVAEAAITESAGNLDTYTITYEFAQITSVEERLLFLDALFAVAMADGPLTSEESAEISRLTSSIRLESRHFAEAKRRAMGE